MGDVADLLMPKLGLTMTEGTVARWMVAPGQRFGVGDIIVVIETDKIATDVEAPSAGEITALLSSEGDVLPVGTPIAQWRLEGVDTSARVAPEVASRPETSDGSKAAPQSAMPMAHLQGPAERIIATPYARRLAREAEIDLALVSGTGPHGRIKADDVLRAKAAPVSSRQLAPTSATAERATPASASLAAFSFASADVDVSALRVLDARLAGTRDRAFERLTYVVLACAKALAGDGDEAVRLGFERNGALAGISGSSRDTLSAIAARIAQTSPDVEAGDVAIFIVEGRARLLVPTIPSGWRMALGVGGVRAVRGGEASHEMTMAVTYDTSTLDHASAARFLDRIAALLEEPLHLLAA